MLGACAIDLEPRFLGCYSTILVPFMSYFPVLYATI